MTTVWITGTTRGLGAALAARCCQAGWRVVGINRSPPGPNHDGNGVRHELCDVTSPAAVVDLVDRLLADGWEPTVIVLNAARMATDYCPPQLNAAALLDIATANLASGVAFLSQLPRLPGTAVVAVSSTAVMVPTGGALGYYAGKLALHHVIGVMAKLDKSRPFKLFILGPMPHAVGGDQQRQISGLRGWLAKFVAVSAETAADRLFHFIGDSRKTLVFPLRAAIVFGLAARLGIVGP